MDVQLQNSHWGEMYSPGNIVTEVVVTVCGVRRVLASSGWPHREVCKRLVTMSYT